MCIFDIFKGLPIIPIPLWGVTTMPKMNTKSEQHKSGESKNSPRFEKSGLFNI